MKPKESILRNEERKEERDIFKSPSTKIKQQPKVSHQTIQINNS